MTEVTYTAKGIEFTSKGAEKVHEFLSAQEADTSSAGLRVGVRGGGCSGFQYQLAFDEQRDGDVVFESAGLKILVDTPEPPVRGRLRDRLRREPAGRRLPGEQPERRRCVRLRFLVPRSRRGRGLSGLALAAASAPAGGRLRRLLRAALDHGCHRPSPALPTPKPAAPAPAAARHRADGVQREPAQPRRHAARLRAMARQGRGAAPALVPARRPAGTAAMPTPTVAPAFDHPEDGCVRGPAAVRALQRRAFAAARRRLPAEGASGRMEAARRASPTRPAGRRSAPMAASSSRPTRVRARSTPRRCPAIAT